MSSEVLRKEIPISEQPAVLQKIIAATVSADEALVREKVAGGLQIAVGSDSAPMLLAVEYERYFSDTDLESKMLPLNTAHGMIWMFNFEHFLSGMTGINVNEELNDVPGLFSLAVSRLPAAIKDVFGWLAPVTGERTEPESSVTLSFRVQTHDCTLVSMVSAEPRVWLSLLNQPQWQPIQDGGEFLPAMPVFADCVVGSSVISLRQLESLRCGDIVMLEKSQFNSDGRGTLKVGQRTIYVKWLHDSPCTQCEFVSWESDMTEEQRSEQPAERHEDYTQPDSVLESESTELHAELNAEASVIADDVVADDIVKAVPIELKVQLGVLALNSRETDALAPGSLLTVETPCPGQVQLFCRNQEVGRGELVDVDGRLGVQIVRNWSKV